MNCENYIDRSWTLNFWGTLLWQFEVFFYFSKWDRLQKFFEIATIIWEETFRKLKQHRVYLRTPLIAVNIYSRHIWTTLLIGNEKPFSLKNLFFAALCNLQSFLSHFRKKIWKTRHLLQKSFSSLWLLYSKQEVIIMKPLITLIKIK